MKLGHAFDPRRNALNAFRLALAIEVIFYHSFRLGGRSIPEAVLQLFFSVGVDGFFALSGFLITASWLRKPQVRDYLIARALRILPGFYICLVVTAFVIAPISVAIQGGSAMRLLLSTAPIDYVVKNSALVVLQFDVGGTPRHVPMAGFWNGSLWSLIWEVLCYLVVAVIGVVGLATRRWVSPAIWLLALAGALVVPPLTLDTVWTIPQLMVRSAIMFSAGAMLYQWRDVIPARWSLVAVSVVLVLAAGRLPDYRVVGALPLAYAVVVSGVLIRNKHLRLRTDLSYGMYIYAFPVQQLLCVWGLFHLNVVVFFGLSTLGTLPLAALSWFLVEKRALSLKSRLKRNNIAPAGEREAGQAVSD